jgi:hypothetical protein
MLTGHTSCKRLGFLLLFSQMMIESGKKTLLNSQYPSFAVFEISLKQYGCAEMAYFTANKQT